VTGNFFVVQGPLGKNIEKRGDYLCVFHGLERRIYTLCIGTLTYRPFKNNYENECHLSKVIPGDASHRYNRLAIKTPFLDCVSQPYDFGRRFLGVA